MKVKYIHQSMTIQICKGTTQKEARAVDTTYTQTNKELITQKANT